jgi:integrase
MSKQKKPVKRYGIWQETTKRHGLCWSYRVRVHDIDGAVKMKTASGFASKGEAEAAVARLTLDSRARQHGIEVAKPLPPVTIQVAVDAYIKALEARWRSAHGADYVRRNSGQVNALRRWAEFAGVDRPITSLTKDDLTFWVEHEAGRGIALSSVRRRINNILAAINHARETNIALAGFRPPRRPLTKDVDVVRMRLLTAEEIKSLSDALASRPEWRDAHDFFKVALGTGGRFDEIIPTVVREDMATAGIKWDDVNAQSGTVRLYSHKTDKWRTLHVPAVVELILQRKKDGRGSDLHVFTNRDHWIRDVFRRASIACEIPYGRNARNGWSPHDLRHVCLSHLLHSGVDLATVRDFAGHEDISETTKYVHATDHSRQLAAAASSALVSLASG